MDPATFFDHLPIVMKQVPPMPGEEALYKWIGSVLDAAAKDPEVMKTLRKTAFAADKELIAPAARKRAEPTSSCSASVGTSCETCLLPPRKRELHYMSDLLRCPICEEQG